MKRPRDFLPGGRCCVPPRPTPLSVDDVQKIRKEFNGWMAFRDVAGHDPHKLSAVVRELLQSIELLHEDLAAARGESRMRATAYMDLRRAIEDAPAGTEVDVPPLAGYLKGGK